MRLVVRTLVICLMHGCISLIAFANALATESCITGHHQIVSKTYNPVWGSLNLQDSPAIHVFVDRPNEELANNIFGIGTGKTLEMFMIGSSIVRAGLQQSHPTAVPDLSSLRGSMVDLIINIRRVLHFWPETQGSFIELDPQSFGLQTHNLQDFQMARLMELILSDQLPRSVHSNGLMDFPQADHLVIGRDFLLAIVLKLLSEFPENTSEADLAATFHKAYKSHSLGKQWKEASEALVAWYLTQNQEVIESLMCHGLRQQKEVVFLIPDSTFSAELQRQLDGLNP